MNKVALILALCLALGSARTPRSLVNSPALNRNQLLTAIRHQIAVGLNLCPTCVQFTEDAIDTLLNIILNTVVIGSCSELCQALAQKTGSQALGAVCDILCSIVGIEEFVKLIEKADLDPIYFCEELKTCKVNDHGDAEITNLAIAPVSGPQGSRSITFTINSHNGTGTGELILLVNTVDGIPVEDGLLMMAQNASGFPSSQSFTLKAEPDPNCDPTQDFCEQWLPGPYQLIVDICNGECGSKHPHSQLYDRQFVNFTITN